MQALGTKRDLCKILAVKWCVRHACLKYAAPDGFDCFRRAGHPELEMECRKPEPLNRPRLAAKARGNEGRATNHKRGCALTGDKATRLDGPVVSVVKVGQYVPRMFEKGSTGSRQLYDAAVSSEQRKSKFAFELPDRPAEVGLRDVESPCRPAEMQFAHHGQGEYQLLEWGSQTHVFTAKMEWSVPNRRREPMLTVPDFWSSVRENRRTWGTKLSFRNWPSTYKCCGSAKSERIRRSYLGLSHATSLSYREAALFGPCGSI